MHARIHEVLAGSIVAVVSLINVFSFASLLAGGTLAAAMPMILSSALVTGAISAFIVARWNSLPFAITGPAGNASSIIGVALLAISTRASGPSLLANIGITLVLSALFSGIALVLLGHFRLGRAIRFVPYPVVAGFLAGTGWLLMAGSMRVVGGGWPVVALIAFTAALWYASTRTKTPYLLPIGVLGGVSLAYLGLLLTHTSLEAARLAG